jgi:2-polyprenyl-3-methyl-5-hydroxy-6-metoxy-1,4-benzoquinol methylase
MHREGNALKKTFLLEPVNPGRDLSFNRARFTLGEMEPNAFVAEVYRRMALRNAVVAMPPTPERIGEVAKEYARHLPASRDAAILDIGYGEGWFMAACMKLGYGNVSGAEFNPDAKPYLKSWGVKLHRIETEIGEFLMGHKEEFDFIHMSHVIEHIPKCSLLWVVDSLYFALKPNGKIFLRTPNMEGPLPTSGYYVTLGHEYGFAGSNLQSLLDICGFDDVEFVSSSVSRTTKRRFGTLLRWPYLAHSRAKHRLFGVNQGGQFGSELIVKATRKSFPPLMNEKYR